VRKIAAKTSWASGTRLSRLGKSYDGARAERELMFALKPLMEEIDREHTAVIERLAQDAVRMEEIKAIFSLYRTRRAWLSMHITITAMLFVFIAVHVGSVALFFLRLG